MRVGILGKRGGWHTTSLQEAFANRGVTAHVYPITQLTARIGDRPWLSADEIALENFDLLVVRAIPGGSLEQVIWRVDLLHRLENAGVRVVNSPTTIERTVDKFYTSSLMEDAGLATPRTIVTEQFNEAMEAFHELGNDIVVKPLFGSEGRGIVRVSHPDIAYRVFRSLEMMRSVYYLQEFVPHGNRDFRVFVVGGRVVGAMVRHGKGWKTNIAQGARGEAYQPNSEMTRLSIEAAEILNAEYAGVDILPLENGGFTILEVNGIPGWRGLFRATGIDAASLLVDYLLESKI